MILRKFWVRLALVVLVSGVLMIWLGLPRLERQYQLAEEARLNTTLSLVSESLRGALKRYEPLPRLVSERQILVDLLNDSDNRRLVQKVSGELLQTARQLKASDLYLMDRSGLVIAASSYLKQLSFVGRRLAFRPYFHDAILGKTGRYFALGRTSGVRGYFFSAPVYEGARVIGVLALKFKLEPFEEAWRSLDTEVIVSDADGVIFMSSRPDWTLRSLVTLTDQVRKRIQVGQQYLDQPLEKLDTKFTPISPTISVVEISEPDKDTTYIAGQSALPEAGWTIHALVSADGSHTQAVLSLFVMSLMLWTIFLVSVVIAQRRARINERFEAQRNAQELLERRVVERTADLNSANTKLLTEIEERRMTEARLRKTQADLVQAGKLAALGQMAAALSHELNQPLAAVKTYCGNTLKFLERDRIEEAGENVSRISQMTDRMASISSHLKNFARQPRQTTEVIDVSAAVDDAMVLVKLRLKNTGIAVERTGLEGSVWVQGGRIRLTQVLVNLFNNAIEAMQDAGIEAPISLHIGDTDEGFVRISVADRGPGFGATSLEQLFDPFFTTKEPGKGLGLGLSISFNIIEDFGGHLRAAEQDGGGSVFHVDLKPAQSPAGSVPDSSLDDAVPSITPGIEAAE